MDFTFAAAAASATFILAGIIVLLIILAALGTVVSVFFTLIFWKTRKLIVPRATIVLLKVLDLPVRLSVWVLKKTDVYEEFKEALWIHRLKKQPPHVAPVKPPSRKEATPPRPVGRLSWMRHSIPSLLRGVPTFIRYIISTLLRRHKTE
ncbi:Uncharacterised protein [uncultured archaeon]|nr:Uncharacterised protein [uncultured archaeon]